MQGWSPHGVTAVEGRLIGITGGIVARVDGPPAASTVDRGLSGPTCAGCPGASCPGAREPGGCPTHQHAALAPADRVICRCLNVTEASILEAIASCPIRTLKDLCRFTQAGEGCMSCRRELAHYVDLARGAWGAERTTVHVEVAASVYLAE